MKKYLLMLAAIIMLPMSAHAAKYEAGTHYEIVKEVGTKQPEVIEFFSYFCPHCYKFTPFMEQIKERAPEGVKFKKNHVEFLGKEMGPEMARAFAAAELLKVEPELTNAMFAAIHDQRRPMTNRDDIKAVFAEVGVDGAKFDSAANSFPVNGMLKQMQRNAETFKIRATPAVVVNGKYLINAGSVRSIDEYSALLNYLLTQVEK
ncbi:thiol:disulfide interchange protein DsbA/DsbL [Motilimonas sp. KMU-193]|uniref:thiol:disulfide interchange protein DsbA/DsbL n=1 Tax=Motilimonas sp. KMU-193 TaxID=3388668 RepID=UPI00396B1D04